MARNKITYEREYSEQFHCIVHRFTGSLRQPTFIEANNVMRDCKEYDFNNIAIFATGNFGEYWLPPEENRVLELFEYDDYEKVCPICGHERDLGAELCPVCMRPWVEEEKEG